MRRISDKPEEKEYLISHKKPWFWVIILGVISVFFVWNKQWMALIGIGVVFLFFWLVAREVNKVAEAS